MDPTKYNQFLEWYTKPATDRLSEGLPKDIQAYCEKNKLSRADLVSLLDHPTFHEDLLAHAINWAKSKAPELFHTYYKKIKDAPNANDFRAFMEMIRPEKKEGVSLNLNFFNIPDDKYNQIVKREARVLDTGGTSAPAELLPIN